MGNTTDVFHVINVDWSYFQDCDYPTRLNFSPDVLDSKVDQCYWNPRYDDYLRVRGVSMSKIGVIPEYNTFSNYLATGNVPTSYIVETRQSVASFVDYLFRKYGKDIEVHVWYIGFMHDMYETKSNDVFAYNWAYRLYDAYHERAIVHWVSRKQVRADEIYFDRHKPKWYNKSTLEEVLSSRRDYVFIARNSTCTMPHLDEKFIALAKKGKLVKWSNEQLKMPRAWSEKQMKGNI